MIISFDVVFLAEKHITANELLICELILKDKHDVLNTYLNSNEDNILQVKKLVEKRYLRNLNNENEFNANKLYVTEVFREMFLKVDFFEELVNKYPVKVLRSDGSSDYLRTDLARCKKMYFKLTENKKSLHNTILKCLDVELNKRNSEGSMAYMKRLPKWLISEEWKIYEGDISNNSTTRDVEAGYGTDLI